MASIQAAPGQQQIWFCEDCRKVGSVQPVEGQTDVMFMAHRISSSHHQVGPECDQVLGGVRVINLKADWRPSLPDGALLEVDKIRENEP